MVIIRQEIMSIKAARIPEYLQFKPNRMLVNPARNVGSFNRMQKERVSGRTQELTFTFGLGKFGCNYNTVIYHN